MIVRRARADEAEALAALAVRSKAHWQQPAAELARFARAHGLTDAVVATNDVWVGEHAGAVAGFYTVLHRGRMAVLDDLWIEPTMIGKGLGRQLFEHATRRAAVGGAQILEWDAEPGAVGFYQRMGAVTFGYERTGDGPARPRMRLALPAQPPNPPVIERSSGSGG